MSSHLRQIPQPHARRRGGRGKVSVDGPRVAYFALSSLSRCPSMYKLGGKTGCHSTGERFVMQPGIFALSSWRRNSAATGPAAAAVRALAHRA